MNKKGSANSLYMNQDMHVLFAFQGIDDYF
jgi:hypothetical protein